MPEPELAELGDRAAWFLHLENGPEPGWYTDDAYPFVIRCVTPDAARCPVIRCLLCPAIRREARFHAGGALP